MSGETSGVLDGAIAPSRNTQLFGHGEAANFLAQSWKSGKGHHAILLEGPEGIGKATLAFRFANHILSHEHQASAPDYLVEPDPQSIVSRQIASGASHNLLHLSRPFDEKTGKQKTAITVDEVRRAGHFLSQTPGGNGWRIIIIDPADDLNRNAANAILKILEEPPKRALFLVLSHAPGRLLPTIRSRCQPLRLSALDDASVLSVADLLGIGLPAERRASLLTDAQGSISRLLKLVNYGGADVVDALDAVLSTTGPAARKAMHKLADVLSQKDSEILFGFFLDHAGQTLRERARTAAFAGDIAGAERLSRLFTAITEKVTVAQAYNLDRKQTIISVLEDMRG